MSYKLIDMMGKIVYENKATILEKITAYYLPIQLPFKLATGQYIFIATLNEQKFTNKLIIE